jgi:hypothetical protein
MVDRTPNYNLELVEFDKTPWHSREHNNWRTIDAIFANFISVSNMQGVWQNSLAVTVGQKFVDPELGTLWEVAIAHTTPSTGLFAASRTTNPTYWNLYSDAALAENWAIYMDGLVNSEDYSAKNHAVGTAVQNPNGSAKRWASEIEDTEVIAGVYSALHYAAKARADAILTAANVVSTNAAVVTTNNNVTTTNNNVTTTNSNVTATNADVVTTNADAVQTAADVASLTGATSTTSLLIEVASKVFTVASGLSFQNGDYVLITSDANPTVNYMHGPITTYTSTTLTVGVTNIGGSGTLNDWTIRRSGTRGATGATGATGPAVANLNDVGDVTITTPSSGQALTYNGASWVNGSGGGGIFYGDNGTTGSSGGDIFRGNNAILTVSEEIPTGINASCTGPLTIDASVTLTVTGTLVII